jgi:magnesium transporter
MIPDGVRPVRRAPRRHAEHNVRMAAANWIDLLDPTAEDLQEHAPGGLEESALELLLAEPQHDDDPRPTLQGHGRYVFGVFLVAAAILEEDLICYQEIDLVITGDTILTVRKTPADGRAPYDLDDVRSAVRPTDSPGMIAYRIVDDVAEKYLDLVDDIDAEIDELEDKVEFQSAAETRERISSLRHDLLHLRRTLAPTRDAVRRVVDDVIEVKEGTEVFPREVEVAFNSSYDKLLRAFDGLELSRDLLASVRDYQQAKIANDQNDVTKRLTVIASVILLPTFIVGLYGQNFHNIPELRWHLGYAYSWALILVTTVIQLWWFRRKKWI